MSKVSLESIAGGALQEKFGHAFDRVMENMQDMNTPYKDKREITVKITFEQNEARDNVVTHVKVSEKLASAGETVTQFAVGKDLKTGKVYAEEYGNQLRGQMKIGDDAQEESTEDSSVIDFRKVK